MYDDMYDEVPFPSFAIRSDPTRKRKTDREQLERGDFRGIERFSRCTAINSKARKWPEAPEAMKLNILGRAER